MSGIEPYLLAFIALFVAIDAAATVPVYLALTEGASADERRRTLRLSCLTALSVGLGFLAVGRAVFHVLGITIADFQVAGGALLFTLSVADLVGAREEHRFTGSPGVVPLGVPLIVGPAVLTTLLIAVDSYGLLPTLCAFLVNMLIAWAMLARAAWITRLIGKEGSRGVAKVMALLMAAIGVMMMRRGIQSFLAGVRSGT